ncbi:MAG: hypothetical protein GXO88_09000, partial [Chlorobi bacterium]|nr:hypothetical protein [Chlorobiota bacterium]
GSWIEVELTEEGKGGSDFEIEAMDLLGRITESETIPRPLGKIHCRFDTSNWNRGVYLIRLKKNGVLLGVRKVILN